MTQGVAIVQVPQTCGTSAFLDRASGVVRTCVSLAAPEGSSLHPLALGGAIGAGLLDVFAGIRSRPWQAAVKFLFSDAEPCLRSDRLKSATLAGSVGHLPVRRLYPWAWGAVPSCSTNESLRSSKR